MRSNQTVKIAGWIARLGLAAAFLSAVADRFGLWGEPGTPGVAWGSISNYEAFVAQLNWFVPTSLVPVVGWTATIAEVVIAAGLLIGWQLRWFSLAAAILLTLFGSAMAVALGLKAPLDYSVFSAVGAAALIFAVACGESVRTTEDRSA